MTLKQFNWLLFKIEKAGFMTNEMTCKDLKNMVEAFEGGRSGKEKN